MLLKKKEWLAREVVSHLAVFRCPICQASIKSGDENSWICQNGHRQNYNRKGYITIAQPHKESKYQKEMLQKRQQLMQTSLFEPIMTTIAASIAPGDKIIDLGCGDGSHLHQLIKKGQPSLAVGVDLSEPAIELASIAYPREAIWMVGDLTNLPLSEGQIDTAITILSPSQYHEAKRVLKSDGLYIKVIPETYYLTELRKRLYSEVNDQTYHSGAVLDHFEQELTLIENHHLYYQVDLTSEMADQVVKMTPLSWQASDETLYDLKQNPLGHITIDVRVLVGKFS